MSGFPGAEEITSTYEDQVEALVHLFRARATIASDLRSRFYGLQDAEIEKRLREDREELERWVVLALVASFEATLRTDAKDRIVSRTRDSVRKPLHDLYIANGDRVRLDDILAIWEKHASLGATVKANLRTLLKHRHWLAHGRHWTNKHGVLPLPLDTYAWLDEYMQGLRASVADFPRP